MRVQHAFVLVVRARISPVRISLVRIASAPPFDRLATELAHPSHPANDYSFPRVNWSSFKLTLLHGQEARLTSSRLGLGGP